MTRQETREWIQTVGVGLLIPAAVAWLAYTNATRDVNAKMIEVAAQVLTGPVNDSMRPVRQWAGKMLQHYSPVPFSASAESTLTNYRIMLVPIPIASTQIVQLKVSPRSIGLLQGSSTHSSLRTASPRAVTEFRSLWRGVRPAAASRRRAVIRRTRVIRPQVFQETTP